MTTGKRPIVVKQLPSSPDLDQTMVFLEEVEASMGERRPRLVLDCSLLQELDDATMHLMLHCLEEALKRNGDVKVAALPSGAQSAFAAADLGRLFDVYDTAGEAVASFHQVRGTSGSPTMAVAQLRAAEAA